MRPPGRRMARQETLDYSQGGAIRASGPSLPLPDELGWSLAARQILVLDRQIAHTDSRCCEDGIGDSCRNWRHARLAQAARRSLGADELHVNLRRIHQADHLIVVEVALDDSA